jgi:hypothetical protein
VWDVGLLEAYGRRHDERAAHRLAWLADVTCTIDTTEGFPGGVEDFVRLEEYVRRIVPPAMPDSLGYPSSDGRLPPVSKRWNITYAADLATFRRRAEHLRSLRDKGNDGSQRSLGHE